MAKELNFSAEIKGKDAKISTSLNVVQFKDSGGYVIYAPALEVYGYGRTVREAKESFKTCLLEFFDYTNAKKTFLSEMKRLGWEIKKRKDRISYRVPEFSELINSNKTLHNIINDKEYKVFKENIPMSIPV